MSTVSVVGVLDVHVDKVIEHEVRENPGLENLIWSTLHTIGGV